MGFFSKILNKLGMDAGAGKVEAMLNAPPPQPAPAGQAPVAQPAAGAAGGAPTQTMGGAASAAGAASAGGQGPAPVRQVDVVAQLEQKAAASSQQLNWRTSIVDLLKLLDIDSSLQARKELATELGCPPDLMNDSAKMNMWLHKAVLSQIAANGGNVPASLLD